ncbi:MAG TPA: exodeoxyribonuclease VII large subunit [Alphaproteobacteria bacterium]|nr:exodeoxyribonuclease VII large subunit [Alphaproteobacteria bacterium]
MPEASTESPPAPRINLPEFSVGELSIALKRTVEEAFPYVRVRGEISGYRGPHASGHAYFALKDETAKLDAVCFKGVFQKLKFKPQEGLEVVAIGRITTYPGKSGYQIIVEALEPAGVGALLALLEERKRTLAAEGLFDAGRKKPLPYLPETIGVITSPTGAVIRDILHRLNDRFPRHVLVWPVTVQGEKAAGEVAAAIAGFNAFPKAGLPRPDVLIVARGGGSIEDLWAFNEEIVVRAAAASAIPLISAVGHETDTTLIDYASDVRAPTPTAAAELAVPVRIDLLAKTRDLAGRLEGAPLRRLEVLRQRLSDLSRAMPAAEALLAIPRQRLDTASGRLGSSLALMVQRYAGRLGQASARLTAQPLLQAIQRHGLRISELASRSGAAATRRNEERLTRLNTAAKMLEALSHKATLARGFALIRDGHGQLIRSRLGLEAGQEVRLTLHDGEAQARIEGAQETPSKAKPAAAAKRLPTKTQGDLF